MERIANRFWIIVIIALSVSQASCATPYEAARKAFYSGNRSYLKNNTENALIDYCQTLGQLETGDAKDVSCRLLKAAIYHRLYAIDAKNIYLNSDSRTKEKYASFSELLSGTDSAGFLNLAFSEIVSAEKELRNKNLKTLDPFLLIHRSLIVADKLSVSLELRDKTAPPAGDANLADFVKNVNSYGYSEVIKAFYLDAWASALVQYLKTLPAKEPPHLTNEVMYRMSLARLKYVYHSLRNTTAQLKTPSSHNLNGYYHEIITRIENIYPVTDISSFTISSPEQAAADLLGEAVNKSYLAINPELHLNEARNRMNQSIEMIVSGKPDKAESHLLNALMNLVCAREFSLTPSPVNTRMIDIAMNDIHLNLYRISPAGQ